MGYRRDGSVWYVAGIRAGRGRRRAWRCGGKVIDQTDKGYGNGSLGEVRNDIVGASAVHSVSNRPGVV
jgi:hypothetical protein